MTTAADQQVQVDAGDLEEVMSAATERAGRLRDRVEELIHEARKDWRKGGAEGEFELTPGQREAVDQLTEVADRIDQAAARLQRQSYESLGARAAGSDG